MDTTETDRASRPSINAHAERFRCMALRHAEAVLQRYGYAPLRSEIRPTLQLPRREGFPLGRQQDR